MANQRRGILIGWIALVGLVLALISPRTWAIVFPAVAISYLASRSRELTAARRRAWSDAKAYFSAVFFLHCAITMIWTLESGDTLGKLLVAILIAAAAGLVYELIASETDANVVRLAEGLWVGFAVGLIYLLIDLLSNGGLRPRALRTVIKFSPAEITRSITPVTILLGPTLLCVGALYRSPWSYLIRTSLVALTFLVVVASPHETSKLALVAWSAIWMIAYFGSNHAANSMLIAGWLAACWLIVPLSFLAHYSNLHKSPYLQRTAQDRILIWNEHAKLILKKPIIGHGFNRAYIDQPEVPELTAELRRTIRKDWRPFRSNHPHNVYIQVWYELGAVGMALFSALGLSVLLSIRRLAPSQSPLANATFAALAVVILSSYGLWQYWFWGLFGFIAVAVAVALRVTLWTTDER